MSTRRERLIEILMNTSTPLSVDDLAQIIGERNKKKIIDDLQHIAKTVKRQLKGRRLVLYKAVCRKCGFTFGSERNLNPTKCPRCKSEWIDKPRFIIK